MADTILFVDDEPNVLDGYRRILRHEFPLDTAIGGEEALQKMRVGGPYAVIVSDMRMPGMNGAQLLAQARLQAPETVRMLLTGYTDVDAAIAAINEGNIFRFLTKPCEKEILSAAVNAGVEQHRLMIAEKELLEQTLMGSIKALSEVLSAASPEAFGRSLRITRYVRAITAKLRLSSPWRFEAAAMLSQLGCVTLEPELIKRSYLNTFSSSEDKTRYESHPQVGLKLLANIPRMEPIAWIISQQFSQIGIYSAPGVSPIAADEIMLGAKSLKIAVAFDNLLIGGKGVDAALEILQSHSEYSRRMIEALAEVRQAEQPVELRKLPIRRIATGMTLQQHILTRSGMLVAPLGHEITETLLQKLENFQRAGEIDNEILVQVPL